MLFALVWERIRAAVPSLSGALVGGVILSFLSYSATYGQFWAFDSHLLPIFSTADLLFNFYLLAIPASQAVVSCWIYYELFFDLVSGDHGTVEYLKGGWRSWIIKLVFAAGWAFFYVVDSDDVYQLGYKICILFITLVAGFVLRRWQKQGLVALRPSRLRDAAQIMIPALGFLSFTVALYGAHETTRRMKSLADSRLFIAEKPNEDRKVIVLFAASSKIIVFDGSKYLSLKTMISKT